MNGMILYPTDDECVILDFGHYSRDWELLSGATYLYMLLSAIKYCCGPLKINETVLG